MSALAVGTIRIGTRGSALALVQANLVAAALRDAGAEVEIVTVETAGDRRAPDTAWGEGAFVAAIQQALLDRHVDVAVHSAKDVPTDRHPALTIGAYLERADPRDCLVLPNGGQIGSLQDLPPDARIGTDSPRRTGFLLAARPDLRLLPLHGNVDTRLRRLDDGAADAVVLAVAGLARLGRGDRVSLALDPRLVPPAPGQGAIAVEARADDHATLRSLAALDHRPTRIAVDAERAVLHIAGGGCRSPIGALASVDGQTITLIAGYATTDGRLADVQEAIGAAGEQLAAELVARLDRSVGVRGAGALRPRVLVTRPGAAGQVLVDALEGLELDPVHVPTVEIAPAPDRALDELAHAVTDADWLVVTSANAVPLLAQALARSGRAAPFRLAAVGAATARALKAQLALEPWTPTVSSAAVLAEELPLEGSERVVLPTTPDADGRLAERLRERGASVRVITAYETVVGPADSLQSLQTVVRSPRGIDAITFMSGSAVRGLLALAPDDRRGALLRVPCVCVGPETAGAATAAGFTTVLTAPRPDATAVAELAARTLRPPNPSAGGS